MSRMKALLRSSLPKPLVTGLRRISRGVPLVPASFKLAATRRRLAACKDVRVNVGCGQEPTPGWINLDLIRNPRIYYWDCRFGLPFGNDAVTAIYAEHFFEHLDYETEARLFLAESLRALVPGGVIRLVVPDAGAYLKAYAVGDWQVLEVMRPLEKVRNGYRDFWLDRTYVTKMEFINAVFRQDGEHKYAYDSETLCRLLTGSGFADVQQRSMNSSADSGMVSDTPLRGTESLYVEGRKPPSTSLTPSA